MFKKISLLGALIVRKQNVNEGNRWGHVLAGGRRGGVPQENTPGEGRLIFQWTGGQASWS